ncbi:MAG TPA: D-alanyl-D-alanine carboxypeptidase [Ruminococcaceae bacterium]|nr:D-alanyl-D-alanine carboxypeptidase [Oscillospiraceae bacterium]
MKKLLIVAVIISAFFISFTVKGEYVSAKSAILICADTGEVLYSRNQDMRLPMASTTKIMTALLVCENGELDKKVTITKEMITVEGTSMGLSAGDVLTRRDLLYGMMLVSGNDAANALAVSVGGSYDKFVDLMNEKAVSLGLHNTRFATPSGLDSEAHYTSSRDLAIITKTAFEYDEFLKVVSTRSIILSYGNPSCKRQLINHNRLLKMYSDVIGVKTGYTKKAGRCLVSAAEKDGMRVIAVTLNDGNDWDDHRKLLDLGLSKLKSQSLSGYSINIPVVGNNARLVVDIPEKSVCVSKDKTVYERIFVPAFLYGPVKKGEEIGFFEVSVENDTFIKEKIISEVDIGKKENPIRLFWLCFSAILRSFNEG